MLLSLRRKLLLLTLLSIMVLTVFQYQSVHAANKACPIPSDYDAKSKTLIAQNNIPTSAETTKGAMKLNGNYLADACGIGKKLVVYGTPENVSGNEYDQSQWRYLGYDINGNVFRNWLFRSDSRATLHVAKNWVKNPWSDPTIKNKGVQETLHITSHPDAKKWLESMYDPYNESPTFIQSYNKRTNKGWTGDTLKDYVVIQQIPTKFTPGVIQMWNIWQPDGSYWYEMFYIPPLDPLEVKEQPDLVITAIKTDPVEAAAASWVGDTVIVQITSKNDGQENSGPFTVGIVGTNIKSEVISNIPPGQIKTVSVKVTSAAAGIIKYTAMTDFGIAVTESNENNNKMPFQIVYSKKNEPTTPIAVISHKEGDHRTVPEITIKPSVNPNLDDILSYSPGKEAITVREWKYTNPAGKTIATKPIAKDLVIEGKYVVELRVTNSAKKVSEWVHQVINVTTLATQSPSATPTSPPEPTPTPRPAMKVGIRFDPVEIIAGETASILNSSSGFDTYEWKFSENLDPLLTDKNKFEYYNQLFTQPGTYRATFKASDDRGSDSATATLTVIDPKPIAIVAGPTRLIEGRAIPVPYHLNNSYTSLESRGVSIDYSRNERRYRKVSDQTYTTNFPTVNNLALGQYILEGKVYDTTNRVSDWANLLVEVVPDQPPTVEVIAPTEIYRNSGFMLYIDAESPDSDLLQHLLLQERYDQNGNGNFEEESWKTLYDGAYKNTHSLNYATVGKRQFRATVTEDYGKKGVSPLAATDVLNYAPSVNFNVFGITQQPGQGEDSAPPVTNYTADSIFRSWTLKKPYIGGDESKLGWKVDGTSLQTKKAEMVKFNSTYPDAGMGANGRNKYQLASDLVMKPKWYVLDTCPNSKCNGSIQITSKIIFNNNRLYTTRQNGGYFFTERDAVTGAALSPEFTYAGANHQTLLKEDEKFYNISVVDNSYVNILRASNKGQTLENDTFNLTGTYLQGTAIKGYALTPDFKSIIVTVEYSPIGSTTTDFYKYNFETRSLVWVALGQTYSGYENAGYFTFAPDGTVYIAGSRIVKISPNGSRVDSALIEGYYNGQEQSIVSLSDDGNYLYRIHGYSFNGETSKMMLTTFNTNDLSIVSKYYFTELNGIIAEERYATFSPVVRADGNVVVAQYNTIFLFTKTGAFITSSKLFTNETGTNFFYGSTQLGLLPNGDVFNVYRYYVYSVGYKYGLYNSSTKAIVVVDDPTSVNRGTDYVIGSKATPILPNGFVFYFGGGGYESVIPIISASGKTGITEIDGNTIGIFDDNWGGMYYDAGSRLKNYALEFNVSVNDITNDKIIGAGIQIQDEKNMFTVEWSKDTLSFYRVVAGAKTLLASTPMTRSAYTTYALKVESIKGTHSVYVNHTKVLQATSTTYTSGFAGIISLAQSNAVFSSVKKTNYGDTYTQETYDTVLVNDPISYEKLFNDIEKDPLGAEEWSYSHNPNFFENPEGLSVHNGKTYGSTINALDKAGVYQITYRAQDNPGLAGYRKWSEPVTKLLYVHRRPVAQPDVRFTGLVFAEGESLDYETYDTSYDPDVAHILSDRLFRTRWADQTTWTTGKREYYNRPGVELIVEEQVRDIHGAWSYWAQTVVYKAAIPPVNQTKPVMMITVPAGTTAAAPTTYVKEPTIRWTYYDAQNDPQEQYRLTLTYVDTNETILYIEHGGNALTYPVLEDTIQQGRVVKVQGQVYSKGVWSDLSNIRYFVLNQPPQTYMLSFNGADGDNPIYTNSNRPQLRVFTVDPENHPITAIDYEVYRASSGAKVVDTESATASVSYTPAALAEGLHYWKARSNDSYIWGPFSSNGFFFVDTVKPADVNEQLEIEPTAVTVTFNAFSDAAPSSGHATRTFYLQRVNANGSVTNIDLNGDGAAEYSTPLPLSKLSYRVTGLVPGQEYRVAVLDYDVAGNEGRYAYIHFSTNRPPTGDFDWSPKPVYEGDLTTFVSRAADPDGDTLSIVYELTSPLGVKSIYSYTSIAQSYPPSGPSLRLTTVGVWSMTMLVSDGIAEPISVTKTIQVLPLQISGYVKHTELWDQHRKQFNLKASGNEDMPRGYALFWAGEKFVLEAETTRTATETKADRVVVQLGDYSTTLISTSSASSEWKGELWDTEFTKLAKGPVQFTFTAYYNNGTVVTTQVNAAIDGRTIDIVSVHRVQ